MRLRILIALVFLTAVLSARAGDKSRNKPPQLVEEWQIHSLVPLGSEVFRVEPAGKTLLLSVTAASPEFEGWRRMRRGNRPFLQDARGRDVSYLPNKLDFTVTASTRLERHVFYEKPTVLRAGPGADPNLWLSGLTFRLKVFRGIDTRVFEPTTVTQSGLPPERSYRLHFDLQDIQAEDRLSLEVFTPDGARVSRFHLELL